VDDPSLCSLAELGIRRAGTLLKTRTGGVL
jgi:hypothetical protein